MKDGQRITFHGEGDQEPGLEPGDVVIVLDQKDHPVYRRQEDNLIMKLQIKLVEALCGFRKTIHTLDDRMLIISSPAGSAILVSRPNLITCLWYIIWFFFFQGQVIKHNDFKCIQNEGMPVYRAPYEKGQLLVQFEVSL